MRLCYSVPEALSESLMRALLFLISAFAAGALLAYPVNALLP